MLQFEAETTLETTRRQLLGANRLRKVIERTRFSGYDDTAQNRSSFKTIVSATEIKITTARPHSDPVQ
jgi:hypothetical protein